MGRARRSKDTEVVDDTVKELKAANRRLKSDNERLKAELSTLQEAFQQTSKYLKGNTDNISVEKIIQGVKKGSTLTQIKKLIVCEECKSSDIKELKVPNMGILVICTECSHRKVIRDGKNSIHQG